jgi:hypothetical protein
VNTYERNGGGIACGAHADRIDRFGGYARFFEILRTYNPGSRDVSESAKALEENANRLH